MANAFTALSGCLLAGYQKSVDVASIGVGMVTIASCCPDASLNDENENGLWTRHTQGRAGRPVFVCPDPQGCGLYLYKSMEIRYNGYESDRKGEGCL